MKKFSLFALMFFLVPAFSFAEPTKEQKVEFLHTAHKKLKELDPYWENLSHRPVDCSKIRDSLDSLQSWFSHLKQAHLESHNEKERLYEDARVSMYKTMTAYKSYLEATFGAWQDYYVKADVANKKMNATKAIKDINYPEIDGTRIDAAQRDLRNAQLYLDRAGSQIAEADSLP